MLVVKVTGILHGNRIDLDRAVTDLPSGSQVDVVVALRERTVAQENELLDQLCGSWSDDLSLGPIFEEILRHRGRDQGRTTTLNGPS